MMTDKLKKSIEQLVCELQRVDLWGTESPSPKQLNSAEPFCVDTLKFEQWLQWVFVPKLSQLVDMPNFLGLPSQSDIHTMARYAFKEYPQETDGICRIIEQIDEGLNQFPTQSVH